MPRYSAFSLLSNSLSGHRKWGRAWRDPAPKSAYDIVIVGGGGHGLAAAYYLAKEHGLRNIAVLEKGWIGSGNVGRNTAIIRSNYLNTSNALFYEFSIKLWRSLSSELNFNVMYSPRGALFLAHSDAQMDGHARLGNSMRLNGIEVDLLNRNQVRELAPYLNFSETARFPIAGALLQPFAGNARHDAVVWGYARGADKYGVDIIQNCAVQGIKIESGRVVGLDTTRGFITTPKVGLAVAGNTSRLTAMAGLRLPIETHLLQAMVTEPLKPFMNHIISFGAGHFHVNQTDKGGLVMGGDLDGYNSYSQRGNLPIIERVTRFARSVVPSLGRLRVVRHWAGINDMTMDGSPIICESPITGLFINGGWCYGGFKSIPGSGWCYAATIATGRLHPLIRPFSLERFETGILIEEKPYGPVPNLH